MSEPDLWSSPEEVERLLLGQNYIADPPLAMAVYLSGRLGKPLLIEGEPGCGKTEVAKALATATGGELIRLQCFEGLDARSALYDWDYPRQLLTIRMHERTESPGELEKEVFSERFLLRRPLLRALDGDADHRPVLIDRRSRPCGRGVRGAPAGGPLGLPGDDPGVGHGPGEADPPRDHHLQPDPRPE